MEEWKGEIMFWSFVFICGFLLTMCYVLFCDPYTDEDGDGLEWSRWKERHEVRPRK
jgi:hypothetical protein